MHKLAKKMAECLKAKVEGMGIDNIEGEALVELGMWVDILKDMVEYDKDMRIIESMDEAEDGEESMKYIEKYEDYPEHDRRGYRGQPRDSMGRYTSRRRGGRMGYEEPPYFRMTPEMYREHDPEYWRDMDRMEGKMYYSGSGMTSGLQTGSMATDMRNGMMPVSNLHSGMRDRREGKSGQMRKGYMEAKEMGKDKQEKMKELEEYMKSMAEDLTEAIDGATPEERAMAKNKLSVLVQKM